MLCKRDTPLLCIKEWFSEILATVLAGFSAFSYYAIYFLLIVYAKC